MIKSKTIILCMMAIATFSACSSDDEDMSEERLLKIEVKENAINTNSNPASIKRRGQEITTSSLSTFNMTWGSTSSYLVKKENGSWTPSPPTWPTTAGNDDNVSFYAYNAGTFYSEGNYVSYTMENNITNQKDFLVAKCEDVTWNNTNGYIRLTFDHACAKVAFTVQITNTLASKINQTNPSEAALVVNSIELKNVYNQGYWYYDSGWNINNATSSSFSLSTSTSLNVTTSPLSLLGDNNYMFVIPQTLGESAALVIKYTYGSEEKTASIPLQGQKWIAGKQYTVNIKLGTSTIEL